MDLGAWHDRENPALELKLKPYTDQNGVRTGVTFGATRAGGQKLLYEGPREGQCLMGPRALPSQSGSATPYQVLVFSGVEFWISSGTRAAIQG